MTKSLFERRTDIEAALREQMDELRDRQKAVRTAQQAKKMWMDFAELMKKGVEGASKLAKRGPLELNLTDKIKSTREELVIKLSDLHYGEVFDMPQYGVRYDPSSIDTILNHMYLEVANEIKTHPINGRIRLWLEGDNIAGEGMHLSQARNLAQGMHARAQVRNMADKLVEFAQRLSTLEINGKRVDLIIDGVYGNHGRPAEHGVTDPRNNHELYMYDLMNEKLKTLRLAGKAMNISFGYSEEYYRIINVLGKVFISSHGHHDIKNSKRVAAMHAADIKYYDLLKRLGVKDYDGHDYVSLAHTHDRYRDSRIIVNGAGPETGEYAFGFKMANIPSQTIFRVHQDWGVTTYKPVNLIRAMKQAI